MKAIENKVYRTGRIVNATFVSVNVAKKYISGALSVEARNDVEKDLDVLVPKNLSVDLIDRGALRLVLVGSGLVSQGKIINKEKETTHIEYEMRWNEVVVGKTLVSLRQLYHSEDTGKHADAAASGQDYYGDESSVVNRLLISVKGDFLSGRFDLAKPGVLTEVAHAPTLNELAAAFHSMKLPESKRFQDCFPTRFGLGVRIKSITHHPDTGKVFVVWTSPEMILEDNKYLLIPAAGRTTYGQNLNSFLELYPRMDHLPYTDNMKRRDQVIIPKILQFGKDDLADYLVRTNSPGNLNHQ